MRGDGEQEQLFGGSDEATILKINLESTDAALMFLHFIERRTRCLLKTTEASLCWSSYASALV